MAKLQNKIAYKTNQQFSTYTLLHTLSLWSTMKAVRHAGI